MPNKPTPSQTAERIIYILAVIFAPSIPLFFLYSKNAAQGLLFRHFLIMGGALAVISLILYLPISKLFLRRRRTMIIIALFWSAFWFFKPLGKIIARGNNEFSQVRIAVYLLIIITMIGFIFRFISMNRLVANTIASLLCLMFAYNFFPSAFVVFAGEKQRILNKKTGKLHYKIKTKFNVDHNIPHPNVYWLHMDGMMGFNMVERYFNDPQTALKNDLAERGFVINNNARLEGGGTYYALPAMTSPVFFDSYYADEFNKAAQLKLVRTPRENYFHKSMNEKGFSLEDIYLQTEIFKAFSYAGYINIIDNLTSISKSKNLDIIINYFDKNVTIGDLNNYHDANNAFNKLFEFNELITTASAFSIIKNGTDKLFKRKRPIINTQPLPQYQETVDKYVTGSSDSDHNMAYVVNAMKYISLLQTPHFAYFINTTAHCLPHKQVIGNITYDKIIGRTFTLDENGNVYKERLEDPNDIYLYLPQHKYAIKQMIAQIDTITDNDPNAVIILQADHGIHGFGNGADYFDSKFLFERGYSLEDQLNLNLSVISAIRIPPIYGKLSQPLDPLDIARYLVNHFVGKGNYDYLYYKEESTE
jgi:hypothetical protein